MSSLLTAMLPAGGDKNTVWNFSGSPTGTVPTLAVGHQAAITCQVQRGGWHGTCSAAGTACLCSPAGPSLLPCLRCPPDRLSLPPLCTPCHPLQSWQPDQEGWLATAGKDGRVYVYDVDSAVAMRDGMPLICPPGAIGLTEGARGLACMAGRGALAGWLVAVGLRGSSSALRA